MSEEGLSPTPCIDLTYGIPVPSFDTESKEEREMTATLGPGDCHIDRQDGTFVCNWDGSIETGELGENRSLLERLL